MERKLASVQRILDIKSIDGADRIDCARILGWECVVGKGDFNIGDLVVFLEVDSVTPQTEPFKLLKDSGYRVKTRKFRKQVSQGLCLPVQSTLAEKYFPLCEQLGVSSLPDGTDVTEALGITKYEPYVPAQLAGEVKGNFPEFLHKTDETRIQAVPEVLFRHQQKKFYVTEKVDGSSCTVYLNKGEFGVCSRNFDMKETEGNSFWATARKLNLECKLRIHATEKNWLDLCSENICLQGELVGPGVQGNKYGLSELHFFVFNIFDINTGRHLDFEPFQKLAGMLRLETVPVVNAEYTLPATVDELVEYSKAKSTLNKDTHREGIVLRPHVNEYDEDLRGRLSFKCINPDFLLKYNE